MCYLHFSDEKTKAHKNFLITLYHTTNKLADPRFEPKTVLLQSPCFNYEGLPDSTCP